MFLHLSVILFTAGCTPHPPPLGKLLQVNTPRQTPPGQTHPMGRHSSRHPPPETVTTRTVCILLECILVTNMILLCSAHLWRSNMT